MASEQYISLASRFVLSFEKIAMALEGLNETYRKQAGGQSPERREGREAIITRVPTQEDRIREAHGAGGGSINDWLSGLEEEEEEIGVREREWIEKQKGSQ